MNRDNARRSLTVSLIILGLFLTASCAPGPYLVYSLTDATFTPVPSSFTLPSGVVAAPLPTIPDTWEVVDAGFADVTGDGTPEWVLAVRRPWRDWPIMAWHGGTSPIAGFRDAEGRSYHLIIMTPEGREVWAGSALPRPIRAMAAGDIDGDTVAEVVTLEGDYGTPRAHPARFIDVWKWDVFGFVLTHRSREGGYRELFLSDTNNDGILDIIVR
jgi:hypothetical protein